jgi:hypothetical protein
MLSVSHSLSSADEQYNYLVSYLLVPKNLTLDMKECEFLSLVLGAWNEFKLCT